ncbi:MAG: tetratricopeptide repeat protein [Candidatus Thorarchaeota archaeon]|jgi:tetratricopeptide (TPR) repeat protein
MDSSIREILSRELEDTENDPRNAEVWFELGGKLYDEGNVKYAEVANRFDEAEEALKGALEHSSEESDVWYNLGCVYMATDQLDDAEISFRRASELNPEDSDTWCNLGVVLSNLGKPEDAERALKKAIEIRSTHFVGWLNLMSYYEGEGRIQDAEKTHERALEHIPDFDLFLEDLADIVEDAKEE